MVTILYNIEINQRSFDSSRPINFPSSQSYDVILCKKKTTNLYLSLNLFSRIPLSLCFSVSNLLIFRFYIELNGFHHTILHTFLTHYSLMQQSYFQSWLIFIIIIFFVEMQQYTKFCVFADVFNKCQSQKLINWYKKLTIKRNAKTKK